MQENLENVDQAVCAASLLCTQFTDIGPVSVIYMALATRKPALSFRTLGALA